MESDMKAFYEAKLHKEQRIRQAKRKYANDIVTDINDQSTRKHRLASIKQAKAKKPMEINQNVEKIYLQAQI